MSGRLDQTKEDLLLRAAGLCSQTPDERPAAMDYLRLYYRHVAPEDLLARDAEDICGPAMAHRQLAAERPQGRAKIRAFTPTVEEHGWDPGHSVVQVVTDDMPFLVDSVTMELARHGLSTHLIIHPLLGVTRNVAGHMRAIVDVRHDPEDIDESWIHIEIDRTTDRELLHTIERDLDRVLNDVRVACEDEQRMRSLAGMVAVEIAERTPPLPQSEIEEAVELLDWLADGHFTFLGFREYQLTGDGEALVPVTGTGLGILRDDRQESRSFAALPPEVRSKARERRLLILTKANSRATVHRPGYLDYVGVKRFDENGDVIGERRFLGLFTHVAYSESIAHIPVLKRKSDEVLDRAGFAPDSYNGQDLIEILEAYPRDELFQIAVDELVPIALGVLRLRERRQLRLFLRKDDYGRYMSCLVYLPRDRYTTEIRLRIQAILREAFHGVTVDYSAMVSESILARLHVVIRVERGRPLPEVDSDELEKRLSAAIRSWTDDLADAIVEQCGEERSGELTRRFGDAFPQGYRADFPARTAVADLKRLDRLTRPGEISINLYEPFNAEPGERRLKIYRLGEAISLSHVLPLLQNMGVEVVDERPYEIYPANGAVRPDRESRGGTGPGPGSGRGPRGNTGSGSDSGTSGQTMGHVDAVAGGHVQLAEGGTDGERMWIYDLGLRYELATDLGEAEIKDLFQDAFIALWRGDIENDPFNSLVLRAGLSWREAMVLRAYAKYIRQTGTTFSLRYICQVLLGNRRIVRLLIRLWESRLDPSLAGGAEERSDAIAEEIHGALDDVAGLDEDRILRLYLSLITATLRTNYFQSVRPPSAIMAGGALTAASSAVPPVSRTLPASAVTSSGVRSGAPSAGAPGASGVPGSSGAATADRSAAALSASFVSGHAADAGRPVGRNGDPWPYKPYLALKFDPERIPDLPQPRPKYEIFIYSPRVEGVHLRFGSVARGGLRWSDRREDFRTEILGLVKAQAVKNTVIVPAGAKGGFVCKRLPDPSADREAYLQEGIACYRQFISGLLDITDNLVDGKVIPATDVVRHDGDDTYLVVAADKGTATFSDIANEVAASYGFWLGDAFASGGSVGYDHKAMGITARGAWESVKYHFRSLGVDVQNEDFSVAGIGDMSGDVFGNGMLLSRHIKLVAAFDHRHVFIDPEPDPEVSFQERERLFKLPRSSWADYDSALISAGGGVYPRTLKSIRITPQMRDVLDIAQGASAMTPDELIHAVLCAPVDLLWNGGIGTYVKASIESNADVGDRANDALRADAVELRCHVVGEGGNLGLTQLGRIEFARGGGLANTDFIDNSAGVDTSDHEVNIKILLDQVVRDGELTLKQRDKLLDGMTGEVAELVLPDNVGQNLVLAAARRQASEMLHVHARYMRRLERDGKLKRRLEFLPDDKALAERRQAGLGLFGPEFAVLLAYAKLTLDDEIRASDLPDDSYLEAWLVDYFPSALRTGFRTYMDRHPLRREIVATSVVNDMVNNGGITFAYRINEETGASVPDLARAYLVAREVFDMPGFWRSVADLNHKVEEASQIAMLLEARKLTERATRWLLRNRRPPFEIRDTIDFFAEGARALGAEAAKLLVGRDRDAFESRRSGFAERGVPDELAEQVALMVPAYSTFDLVEIAAVSGRPVTEAAEVYFDLADRLQLSRLRERIIALPRDDRWRSMARAALRDDLYAAHAALTRDVLMTSEPGSPPEDRLAAWSERNNAVVSRARQTLAEIWESDSFDLATLSVALGAIRTLVTASTLPFAEH